MTGIEPGNYMLWATAGDHRSTHLAQVFGEAEPKDPMARPRSNLEIVMSNRGAVVSGKVTDDGGNPVRGARVVLLSTNQDRWTQLSSFSAARTTSAPDGTYRLGPQREGDYFVLAFPSTAAEPPGDDRDRLKRLTELAERVTLSPGEERSLDLRVLRPE